MQIGHNVEQSNVGRIRLSAVGCDPVVSDDTVTIESKNSEKLPGEPLLSLHALFRDLGAAEEAGRPAFPALLPHAGHSGRMPVFVVLEDYSVA
jgi:hypothetical protein